jgi:hypothetical protein
MGTETIRYGRDDDGIVTLTLDDPSQLVTRCGRSSPRTSS